MLTVAVLGPLEVARDGRRVPVPVGKASELVVRLALDPGTVIRVDRLIEDLWGTVGTRARPNTLQSKVTMLRRAVGDPGAVISRDGGYSLAVDAADVDALAVLGSTATAARLVAAGDDRGAADLCASMIALYRGEVLQAAGDGEWVAPHRARLEEARMKLIEMQVGARVRLGEADEVVGQLEALVAGHPFQESLWELLIIALYRSGRQADALAAYQTVREQLATELGLDPRPQLQQLEHRILVQDASLDVVAAPARVALVARKAGNLPSLAADLIGRDDEVAAWVDLLGSHRLVEIVGTGGIGKSAVAIAVGRRLAATDVAVDGVWLARLESAATPEQVTDVLISAIGGPGDEAALLERLRDSDTVVILDNCEHVVEAAAVLAVRLLDAAPGLRVLCTSQVPLDVAGEVVVGLGPLTLAHSVELFSRRAAAQRTSPPEPPDEGQLLDLCRALDGLPLAIELAAARTRTLSVPEITRRLGDRFRLLSDPTSRKPERRRSLKSTIGWSYGLLFPDDQRGLWALAAFAGSAPLPAVESVLEALDVPAVATIDVVGRLASRSLVSVEELGGANSVGMVGCASAAPTRYRLLDSIRAFAWEMATEAGLSERARAAHAAWFARVAASSTDGVRSGRQAEHLSFATAERANIDAALSWSCEHDPVQALGIATGFGWAWVVLGDSRGAQRLLTALDAMNGAAPPRDEARALLLAAWIEASTGSLDRARHHLAAAEDLAGTAHDPDLQARCAYYLAYVVSHDGDFRTALELTARSRGIYDTMNRPWDQAANALFAARAAISAGDRGRGVQEVDKALLWLRELDDPWLRVRGEAIQGELARLEHRFDDAVVHLQRAVRTSGRLGFQQTEAFQLSSLGRAQCQAGDYETGARTIETAIAKAQATGDVRLVALGRVHLGRVLRAVGDDTRARAVLEAASTWHREAGGGEQAVLGECLLAAMDAADAGPDAEARLTTLLDRARDVGSAPAEIFAIDALARIAAREGDRVAARALLGEADERMDAGRHLITDLDRADARQVRPLT